MELEEPTAAVKLPPDGQPKMPEPPPVRLLAIADVHLSAWPEVEHLLVGFYVGLLKFDRDTDDTSAVAFKAEKHRIVFGHEAVPAPRDNYRPILIETPFYDDFVHTLLDREIAFDYQRGTAAGVETVFLQDPAGYWVSVGPVRAIP